MKIYSKVHLILVLLCSHITNGQDNFTAINNYWQIGLGLGELPMNGSFKPSISIGYHFNKKLYTGLIFQFKDHISRNGSSFNARSSQINGLVSASESVSHRFLLQVRYTPFKRGPYLSGGLVFNGQDSETMIFDSRNRSIPDVNYDGTIEIRQTRPSGGGIALGLGYQYDFKNGYSVGFEWTPAWNQSPTPSYIFSGTSNLSDDTKSYLQWKMDKGFKSSVTNMYKVFHLGVAYRLDKSSKL